MRRPGDALIASAKALLDGLRELQSSKFAHLLDPQITQITQTGIQTQRPQSVESAQSADRPADPIPNAPIARRHVEPCPACDGVITADENMSFGPVFAAVIDGCWRDVQHVKLHCPHCGETRVKLSIGPVTTRPDGSRPQMSLDAHDRAHTRKIERSFGELRDRPPMQTVCITATATLAMRLYEAASRLRDASRNCQRINISVFNAITLGEQIEAISIQPTMIETRNPSPETQGPTPEERPTEQPTGR